MHKQNTRRGFTQILIKKSCHSRGFLSGIYNACRCNKKEQALLNKCVEDPRLQPSGMTPSLTTTYAFTLIELLVVVLIIGILAAVAVPQYQVAVKKAQLAKYIPLVKTFTTAEEAYYLANGKYTTDLTALDVEMPAEGCTTTIDEAYGRIDCGTGDKKITYIMVHPYAVQSGDQFIRYVYYLADDTSIFKRGKKGDIECFSNGEIARKTCKTLGPGKEIKDTSWDYYYKLD